jgi:uncharacterized protein YbaR (Trm112 family)
MEISLTEVLACPVCRREARFAPISHIDAERRPGLRQAVLDGSLQRQVCPDCGTAFRMPPDLWYVDRGRGQWIAAFSWEKLRRWRECERHAHKMLARTIAPEGRTALTPRITFGWSALREKVLLAEEGLDDIVLELCKYELAGGPPDERLAAGTETRLLRIDNGDLWMATIQGDSEQVLSQAQVPQSQYATVAADDSPSRQDLRTRIAAGLFVDVQRLTIEAG